MNTMSTMPGRRFYRDADRARLGGVCAGLAGYFGLNLRVTRILAIIAFFMAMPFAVAAYLGAVIFFPATSRRQFETGSARQRKRRCRTRRRFAETVDDAESVTADSAQHAETIKRRCGAMDERLKTLERLVTSRRYQLEQELRNL